MLTGPSGSGKSDLALRLIDAGAALVSDDQTLLVNRNGLICAAPPPSIAGMIEIRHVGLVRLDYMSEAPVRLYVELTPNEQNLERLPELSMVDILGIAVRRLWLPAFAASTPAKIRLALRHPCVP